MLSMRKHVRVAKRIGLLFGLSLLVGVLPGLTNAQTRPPVLLTNSTSTRAIALESPTFFREPFNLTSPFAWSADGRTRVMLFALNLSLQPGEDLSVVTAEAEDAAHRPYNLQVEYVGPAPGQVWLSTVILRLSDDLTNVGDVLVRVAYRGVSSNRVRLGIGSVGGGPPDDPGAAPAIVPPYVISGQVATGGSGFGGVSVTLSGPQTQTVTTDSNGSYSFTVTTAADDYTLTVSKPFYNFAPQTRTFHALSNNQPSTNFVATRQIFTISGLVALGAGGFSGVPLTLSGPQTQTVTTDASGSYSFTVLAGEDYTLSVSKPFYNFTPPSRAFVALSDNQFNTNFVAVRQIFTISGRVIVSGSGFSDVPVTLSGPQTQTANTDAGGFYSFTVLAGEDYTLSATKQYYNFAPQSQTFNALSTNQPGANFLATRQSFTISGRALDDQGQALNGIQMALLNEVGGTIRTALTSAGGNYSFSDITAGLSYTAVATSNNFFTFAPQGIGPLAGNLALDFRGVRRAYAIHGRVTDETGHGLGGAAVNLSGSQTTATTTDSDGNYSFPGLPAGGNYAVATSKLYYVFSPPSQSFNNLSSNQTGDFDGALPTHSISGRVTDNGGQGLIGVKIDWIDGSGTRSGTLRTGSDGRFSFSAPATGNYTITPSMEQDSYLFTPSNRSLQNLSSDQTLAAFTATLAPLPVPSYVIECDGTPKSVDYGLFWEPYVDLGHFYWEFWAMPGNNAGATYLVSDGYGGDHALLFGVANFGTSEPGRYQLLGNIWDGYAGNHLLYFGSDQGPAPGEWGHFAVGWDGQNIITYFNGVPVGKTAFAGPRQSPSPGHGGNRLLIGGSDHNNFIGRIAQVRGYENSNPLEDATGPTGGTVEAAFAPQTVFGVGGSMLSYYFRPASKVADLSRGYGGSTHTGTPRGTIGGVIYDCGACPPPQFVLDPTAPDFVQGIAPQPVQLAASPPVPARARVFDSFSRANSTYLFNSTGGLGLTEAGTARPQAWQTGLASQQPQPFGILNGSAVLLANERAVAWVATGASEGNLDVRVNRHPGLWGSGLDTGLSFRVVDNRNFFFAYTSESNTTPGRQNLSVGYYLNGSRFDLVTMVSMPVGWTTLNVVTTEDGSIKVYADQTLVYSTSSDVLATATGAGLYNNSPGLALVNRWDNFTVY